MYSNAWTALLLPWTGKSICREVAPGKEIRVAVSLQHSITVLRSFPKQRAVARKRKGKADLLPGAAAKRTKHEANRPSSYTESLPGPCSSTGSKHVT